MSSCGSRIRSSKLLITCLPVLLAWSLCTPTAAWADDDPFAPKGKAGKEASPAPVSPTTGGSVSDASNLNCPPLSAKLCKGVTSSLLLVSGGYLLVCLLFGVIINAWWSRRSAGSEWGPFLAPMFLMATVNGILVGLDPLASANLKCCLANALFRTELLLGDTLPGRVFLLGVVPLIALYVLVILLMRWRQNAKAR